MTEFNDFFNKYAVKVGVRASTFKLALSIAEDKQSKNFMETGCIRLTDNWGGDGYSTFLFADFVRTFGGHVWSCDIDEESIATSKEATKDFVNEITYVCDDSINFLSTMDKSIDFLYLDSLDGNLPQHAEHQLLEIKKAEPHLHNNSIILLDDIVNKGIYSMPYLMDNKWAMVLKTSAQAVFIR